jgi:hypothetical protein
MPDFFVHEVRCLIDESNSFQQTVPAPKKMSATIRCTNEYANARAWLFYDFTDVVLIIVEIPGDVQARVDYEAQFDNDTYKFKLLRADGSQKSSFWINAITVTADSEQDILNTFFAPNGALLVNYRDIFEQMQENE